MLSLVVLNALIEINAYRHAHTHSCTHMHTCKTHLSCSTGFGEMFVSLMCSISCKWGVFVFRLAKWTWRTAADTEVCGVVTSSTTRGRQTLALSDWLFPVSCFPWVWWHQCRVAVEWQSALSLVWKFVKYFHKAWRLLSFSHLEAQTQTHTADRGKTCHLLSDRKLIMIDGKEKKSKFRFKHKEGEFQDFDWRWTSVVVLLLVSE